MKIKRDKQTGSSYICVQNDNDENDIQRVRAADADQMVAQDGYHYVPRAIWKTQVRDAV